MRPKTLKELSEYLNTLIKINPGLENCEVEGTLVFTLNEKGDFYHIPLKEKIPNTEEATNLEFSLN